MVGSGKVHRSRTGKLTIYDIYNIFIIYHWKSISCELEAMTHQTTTKTWGSVSCARFQSPAERVPDTSSGAGKKVTSQGEGTKAHLCHPGSPNLRSLKAASRRCRSAKHTRTSFAQEMHGNINWEFQDPKMELLYHISGLILLVSYKLYLLFFAQWIIQLWLVIWKTGRCTIFPWLPKYGDRTFPGFRVLEESHVLLYGSKCYRFAIHSFIA